MAQSDIKTFLLAAVAISLGVWTIAFNFGVFLTIFFEHLFSVWIACTALFLASLFLPASWHGQNVLFGWRGKGVLLFPTFWVILRVFDNPATHTSVFDHILWWSRIPVGLICLPYILYILVIITSPDLLNLKERKLLYALIGIVVFIGIMGYVIGRHNQLLLSCYDFQVSGNDLPAHCKQ